MFYFNPTFQEGSFSTISTDAFENMSGLSHFEALNDGFWRSCPETSHWLPFPHQNLFTTRTSISHQFGCPFCLLSRKSFQLSGTLVSTRDFKCTLMLSYINTPALQQTTTHQWLSHWSRHQNHQKGVWNHRILCSVPGVSESVCLGWGSKNFHF